MGHFSVAPDRIYFIEVHIAGDYKTKFRIADFAIFGLRINVNYFVLSISIFTSSMIFTMIGLLLASYARSVNQYMLLVSPLEIVVTVPPILAVFGITHPVFNTIPGMALWRMISYSIGVVESMGVWPYFILIFWFGIVLLLASGRIPKAMQADGGEKV